MKVLIVAASVSGVFGSVAIAKEREPGAKQSQPTQSSKDPKAGNIKDEEAVRCVQARLEEQTGVKGWKIDLKDGTGSSRDFTATNGARSEKGFVNVLKSYPNQGLLRVYLVPRD
jgi:hypothetical protein